MYSKRSSDSGEANSSISGGDFLKALSIILICANFIAIMDISVTFPKYLLNNKLIVLCSENVAGSHSFVGFLKKPASGVANVNIPGSTESIAHALCPFIS